MYLLVVTREIVDSCIPISSATSLSTIGRIASSLDAVGALSFLGLAMLGYLVGHFFQQWIARGSLFSLGSTPFIVLCNLAILLKVGAGLFAGFIAIAVFGRALRESEEGKEVSQ